jgi:hypothetical protein
MITIFFDYADYFHHIIVFEIISSKKLRNFHNI